MSEEIKDMLRVEEELDFEIPQDVIEDLVEKTQEDIKEPEHIDKPILDEGLEKLSEENSIKKHNSKVKKLKFKKRALNKELQLEGVSPDELAKNPKLFRKYSRKVHKINLQKKLDSNKKQREESKIIERNYKTI